MRQKYNSYPIAVIFAPIFMWREMKHYTIPVFIPELACPFQCAFCNQRKISGHVRVPDEEDIVKDIQAYLASFKQSVRHVEVGFFGGNFTGIPLENQEKYLRLVQPYLKKGIVHGIRLSTRPDYINREVLELLKKYGVTTVELGAQSLDDGVLKASFRGHTAAQVAQASDMVLGYGFKLGLQMMIGLPQDDFEKSMATALEIVRLGATNTRIYPALIIKDTAMHHWFGEGRYKPLTMEEAVEWSKHLLLFFEKNSVKVIRMGLHPSEGLLRGNELVAGPFHPSFRELVMTEIWADLFAPLKKSTNRGEHLYLEVAPSQINYAIGYGAINRKRLLSFYKKVTFTTSADLQGRDYREKQYCRK